ncbi:MAG TPA: SEL1-like repeat protein [Candidatus Ignatzschineria merdigallinarum]|uniref:SEL1-like repeat protein n=1 Tax=Candidatus Ignatzschineria merdigallinarum TaxID=2838621 RepID=A0A9D1TVM0_9GAMM|nr:SEL1-like repeat protein [Candidatus Ignatzschineria merdigallinarum]
MFEYFFTRISAAFKNKVDLYRMGTFYYEGKYVPKDYRKATQYLQQAVNKKYTKALYYLGLIELEKSDSAIDLALALRYFLLSKNEEPRAIEAINHLEAKILELPITEDNTALLFKIGYMYANDVIIGLSVPKAVTFYELAASRDHHYARTELAKLLTKSRPGITKDLPRAKALLELPAQAGFSPAIIAMQDLLAAHPELKATNDN